MTAPAPQWRPRVSPASRRRSTSRRLSMMRQSASAERTPAPITKATRSPRARSPTNSPRPTRIDTAAPTWTVDGRTTPHTAQYSFRINEFKVARTGIPGNNFTFDDSFDTGNAPSDSTSNAQFQRRKRRELRNDRRFRRKPRQWRLCHAERRRPCSDYQRGSHRGKMKATSPRCRPTSPRDRQRSAAGERLHGRGDLRPDQSGRTPPGVRHSPYRTGRGAARRRHPRSRRTVTKHRRGCGAAPATSRSGRQRHQTLQDITLNPTAQEDHILLRLSHVANGSAITASFDLYAGNAYSRTISFTTTDDIFHGEDFTRASFFAATPNPSISYRSGNYGTLSINSTGA